MTDSRPRTLIVALLLLACGAAGAQAPRAPALDLPASFTGDLPCADCTAIRHHLDLWPDGVFHLHREWVGRKLTRDEIGRWQVDAKSGALLLQGSAGNPSQWEIKGPKSLRMLDQNGAAIVSNLPYELTGGTLAPAGMSLSMGGEVTYMADALRITECLTGRSYPVAQVGDSRALERAYVADVKSPGAPLYVTLQGSIEERPKTDGAGTRTNVVVDRFINTWPAQSCERARADSSLPNTHWKIVQMAGTPVRIVDSHREPSLTLRAASDGTGNGRPGYSATVGCNQLGGTYDAKGNALTFGAGMSTLMACAPPLGDMERRLSETLEKTRHWQVTGPTLELMDEQGESLALLEAVYLK
jgi:heat shock protein HslJ